MLISICSKYFADNPMDCIYQLGIFNYWIKLTKWRLFHNEDIHAESGLLTSTSSHLVINKLISKTISWKRMLNLKSN